MNNFFEKKFSSSQKCSLLDFKRVNIVHLKNEHFVNFSNNFEKYPKKIFGKKLRSNTDNDTRQSEHCEQFRSLQ